MTFNPADTDFAEHAALEAETPATQCAWCDLTAAAGSDICEYCQIEEAERLSEAYYDDDSYDCGCCSCCGCSCDLYDDYLDEGDED